MAKIYGQLEKAQFENIAGTPALLVAGRFWADTTVVGAAVPKFYTGTTTISMLAQPTQSTVTTNTVLSGNDNKKILCNHSVAISITLPPPTTVGQNIEIVDITGNAQTNNITVVQNAAETIGGLAASKVYQTNYGGLKLTSDGANWWIT